MKHSKSSIVRIILGNRTVLNSYYSPTKPVPLASMRGTIQPRKQACFVCAKGFERMEFRAALNGDFDDQGPPFTECIVLKGYFGHACMACLYLLHTSKEPEDVPKYSFLSKFLIIHSKRMIEMSDADFSQRIGSIAQNSRTIDRMMMTWLLRRDKRHWILRGR